MNLKQYSRLLTGKWLLGWGLVNILTLAVGIFLFVSHMDGAIAEVMKGADSGYALLDLISKFFLVVFVVPFLVVVMLLLYVAMPMAAVNVLYILILLFYVGKEALRAHGADPPTEEAQWSLAGEEARHAVQRDAGWNAFKIIGGILGVLLCIGLLSWLKTEASDWIATQDSAQQQVMHEQAARSRLEAVLLPAARLSIRTQAIPGAPRPYRIQVSPEGQWAFLSGRNLFYGDTGTTFYQQLLPTDKEIRYLCIDRQERRFYAAASDEVWQWTANQWKIALTHNGPAWGYNFVRQMEPGSVLVTDFPAEGLRDLRSGKLSFRGLDLLTVATHDQRFYLFRDTLLALGMSGDRLWQGGRIATARHPAFADRPALDVELRQPDCFLPAGTVWGIYKDSLLYRHRLSDSSVQLISLQFDAHGLQPEQWIEGLYALTPDEEAIWLMKDRQTRHLLLGCVNRSEQFAFYDTGLALGESLPQVAVVDRSGALWVIHQPGEIWHLRPRAGRWIP